VQSAVAGTRASRTTATLGSARVSLPRGSYCWQSGGTGTCADSASADTLLRSGYLKPFMIAGGVTARVNFSTSPRQVSVTLVNGPTGRGGSVAHAAAFDLSSVPGEYVYVISGTWHEGTVDFYLAVHVVNGYT
jgi:hypothetical protein